MHLSANFVVLFFKANWYPCYNFLIYFSVDWHVGWFLDVIASTYF